MLTRDSYIALLEKRASMESSIPPNDSAAETHEEFKKNQADNREYLHSIFNTAGAAADNMQNIKKSFGDLSDKTVIGHPLLKVANREFFFSTMQSNELLKTASPLHIEVAFSAFCDELEKIAALKPQNLAQVAAKNRVAMSRPAKAWDLSSPASSMGAAAKPTLPQGSGTSVHTGGILARLGLK